jgi:hypothetical protein
MELRLGGVSFQQIADTLGYHDRSGARKAVLQGLRKTPHEPSKKLRQMTRERINRLWLSAFPRAQNGDPKMIMACIRLLKRQADFEGLDRPKKVRVKGKVHAQVKGPAYKIYAGFNPADILPPMPAESQGPPAGS